MKLFLIIPLILGMVACTSMKKSNIIQSPRAPSSATSFDDLPLCSRIKYFYSTPRIPLNALPTTFDRDAINESKQIWQAGKVMESDTLSTEQICSPILIQDLFEKPAWCKSMNWSGPYLDQQKFQQYQNMTKEDFATFINCWQK